MTIALGSDHAGFRYKELVKELLTQKGHDVLDFGTHSADPCDYPDFIFPAARAVQSGQAARGFIFGGSGNGEAICANRLPGVRCAVVWSPFTAEMARAHNDANVMSVGERTIAEDVLREVVEIFMRTEFEGGRHARRIGKIDQA